MGCLISCVLFYFWHVALIGEIEHLLMRSLNEIVSDFGVRVCVIYTVYNVLIVN